MLTLLEMIVISNLTGPGLLVAGCGILLALWSLVFTTHVIGEVALRARVL